MSNLNNSRNTEVNNDALISERFLLYHVKQSSIRKKVLGVNENSTHLQSTMRKNSRQNQFNKNLDIVHKNKFLTYIWNCRCYMIQVFLFLNQRCFGWIKHLWLLFTNKKYFLSHLKPYLPRTHCWKKLGKICLPFLMPPLFPIHKVVKFLFTLRFWPRFSATETIHKLLFKHNCWGSIQLRG